MPRNRQRRPRTDNHQRTTTRNTQQAFRATRSMSAKSFTILRFVQILIITSQKHFRDLFIIVCFMTNLRQNVPNHHPNLFFHLDQIVAAACTLMALTQNISDLYSIIDFIIADIDPNEDLNRADYSPERHRTIQSLSQSQCRNMIRFKTSNNYKGYTDASICLTIFLLRMAMVVTTG